MSRKVIATVTADGAAGAFYFEGGPALIQLAGTWTSGSSIKLQASTDGATYSDFRDDAGFSADGVAVFDNLPPCWLRVFAADTDSTMSVVASLTPNGPAGA